MQCLATWDAIRLDPVMAASLSARGRTEATSVTRALRLWPDDGGPWQQKDDEQLVQSWEAGTSIPVLAVMYTRKPEQILSRLSAIGAVHVPARDAEATAQLRAWDAETSALWETVASLQNLPQAKPSAAPIVDELFEEAGIPVGLRARPWLELALLAGRASPTISCRGERPIQSACPDGEHRHEVFSHPARNKSARSHRRARTFLETQEPVLPFL